VTYPDDDDVIPLGNRDDEDEDDGPDLGPDERDRDLLDGSWEQAYYSGQTKKRDWNSIYAGVAILILLALIIPALLVFFQ